LLQLYQKSSSFATTVLKNVQFCYNYTKQVLLNEKNSIRIINKGNNTSYGMFPDPGIKVGYYYYLAICMKRSRNKIPIVCCIVPYASRVP